MNLLFAMEKIQVTQWFALEMELALPIIIVPALQVGLVVIVNPQSLVMQMEEKLK